MYKLYLPVNKSMHQFYPFEINGTKYLMCKLPGKPFSTLHDPKTKQIVGQWNNHDANYEIFHRDEEFEQHMRKIIASGVAFTFA